MNVLFVVPPVVRDVGHGPEIDLDFSRVLEIYLERFDRCVLACPIRTQDAGHMGLGQCVPISDLDWPSDRFEFIPLPTEYRPLGFLRSLRRIREILRAQVLRADCLVFSPYSLFGDWPTVAIREAVRLKRNYTLEADAVHADVARSGNISPVAWKRWFKKLIEFPLFEQVYRYNLRHSTVAIFQGQDVYAAFARFCSRPIKLNHHVPIYAGDHIPLVSLQAKMASVMAGEELNIVYAGRVLDIKGPYEWLSVLRQLQQRGVRFRATWYGDGPLLRDMREAVADLPNVTFAGPIPDRSQLLQALREGHIFLFCHKSRESARVLGEALASAAPLVGFRADYPADLVSDRGGGLFSQRDDLGSLTSILADLDRNRSDLAELIEQAAASGKSFDRDALLRERVAIVEANGAD